MARSHFRNWLVLLAFLSPLGASAPLQGAETIEFPEDELAVESVLPVFDHPVSVKNKSVLISKRWEIGPTFGMAMLEPFFNPMNYGGMVSYHLNEESAINVLGLVYAQGISANAQGLNPIPKKTQVTNANLQNAPAPQYLLLGNYQYTPFYGKISITKDYVMNLSAFGFVGGGFFAVGDSVNPALNFGVGEKLYFSPNWSFRVDFRVVAYQGPDILSVDLSQSTTVQSASKFGQKLQFPSLLSASLVYLFPGM